jgi:hypothetical protein
MGNRFNADQGAGVGRGSSPVDFSASASTAQRGSVGSDGQNPTSSAGFRQALAKTGRSGNRLKDQLPNKKTFGGKGFKKPNYFAQGGKRHGLHMGAGAPFTGPADGADVGGE